VAAAAGRDVIGDVIVEARQERRRDGRRDGSGGAQSHLVPGVRQRQIA